MARAAKLKVFRTPIGFHDAYVAAPSRKAALAAWGSDADLFARGIAEQVDDPELTREPLAQPGIVIKRLRGTSAEQLAALPPDPPPDPPSRTKPRGKTKARKQPKPADKAKPRPSRAALNAAEAAIAAAEAAYKAARAGLAEEEKRLARARRELEDRYAAEQERLEEARRREDARHARELQAWRG